MNGDSKLFSQMQLQRLLIAMSASDYAHAAFIMFFRDQSLVNFVQRDNELQ